MSSGKTLGYVRVSSLDQNPERQLEGLSLDKVFTDKASGKDMSRPQLVALLQYAREGDTIIVHSMDRLARNLDDLRHLVSTITARHIAVHFVKEQLHFTGEDSPMANLLLSVMGAFAEFERALIRERQLEGITLAKKRGFYRGRKNALTPAQVIEARERINNGEKKSVIVKDMAISPETLYKYLKIKTDLSSDTV